MNRPAEVLSAEQKVVLAASAVLTTRWDAYLAGGLAAALHLGHRRSNDFDWFTPRTLPPSELLADLRSTKMTIRVRQNDQGTFLGEVGGTDYSVFRYPYPLAEPPISIAGCAVASLKDIAAMKMTAIVQRSTKRDYVDLHAIFTQGKVRLSEVLATMERKYPGYDTSLSLRALRYFRDVEGQTMPAMLARTSWETIKRELPRVMDRDRGRGGPAR